MISKRAKTYCKDDISLVENYEKAISDKDNIWYCHHRREIEIPRKELIEIGEYFNRPASELIFLTKFEHNSLHSSLKFKGCKLTEETKLKISKANKGNKSWLGRKHSEEAKQKISKALKGREFTEEWKRKLSEAQKNRSEEINRKISEFHKGRHWFNNGLVNIQAKSCPEGFVKGRLKKAI